MTQSRELRVLIAAAIAVVICAELAARTLRPHLPPALVWDNPYTQAKADAAQRIGSIDVTVVGSSIANAGLDTPTLVRMLPWATTGYNMALPSATPRKWELWTRDVVLPLVSPRVLVVAVSPRDTNDTLQRTAALSRYTNAIGRSERLEPAKVRNRLRLWLRHHCALYAIRTRLREPTNLARHLQGHGDWSPSLSHEGRTELFDDGTYDYQRARAGQRRFHTFENYRVGPLEFGAIERLVTDAQSAGAFVVLLELPYMRKALASIIPSGEARLNEFHELLARTATRLDLPLLTQRDMMNRGEFFADFYHPNAKGTRLLSTRTGAWLANALPQDPTPVTGH